MGSTPAGRIRQLDPQSVLEQVFAVCGRLHPAVRYSLGAEARHLWRSFGITQPVPKIVQKRPLALATRERGTRLLSGHRTALKLDFILSRQFG